MRTTGPPPHGGRPVALAGPPPAEAEAAIVLLHGRGGTAEGILPLAAAMARVEPALGECAVLAPQAAGNEWYPHSFLAPVEGNARGLGSALAVLADLLERLAEAGIPRERVVQGGFSQGACLALESMVRAPGRYGAGIGLSGGLIGPPGTTWEAAVPLDGTPVFLGCSDVDPHIPRARLDETAAALERLGAEVELAVYPGMGHTVVDDEVRRAARIAARALG